MVQENQVTIHCRLSYVHVFEPDQVNGQGEPKYSVACLIDKADTKTIQAVKAAIQGAVKRDAERGKKLPSNFKLNSTNQPLKDGDDKEAYQDMDVWYINAKSSKQPKVMDKKRIVILDEEKVYSGCYAWVAITFFAYNASGNKGVAAALDAIMLDKDGERLDGQTSAENRFDGISDDPMADNASDDDDDWMK